MQTRTAFVELSDWRVLQFDKEHIVAARAEPETNLQHAAQAATVEQLDGSSQMSRRSMVQPARDFIVR